MRVVEITEHKIGKLSDHIEEGLRHLGKAMQCVDEWMEESGMGHRGGMNYRQHEGSRYDDHVIKYRGGRMDYRDEWEYDDMGERYDDMDERRRRNRRTGRYM